MNNDDISPTRPLYEGITLPFWDIIALVGAGVFLGFAIALAISLVVVIV